MMVGHLVPGVERPDGPDDGLAAVGEHGAVQLVGGPQRALVRHDGVPVHQRRVQQPDRVRVLLQIINKTLEFQCMIPRVLFAQFFC